jgi:hypothetical protein
VNQAATSPAPAESGFADRESRVSSRPVWEQIFQDQTDTVSPPISDVMTPHISPDQSPNDSANNLNNPRRPLLWAMIASVIWLAVITGGLIALARAGRLATIDATTVASYAAGIFTPLTAFWLMALAMMRGGALASERDRATHAIEQLVAPIDAARHRATGLATALEQQILRMSAAADAAEAKATALHTAASREADTLKQSGETLDALRGQIEKTITQLQDAMGQAQSLTGRLDSLMPEAAKRLMSAIGEARSQSDALVAASTKVSDASAAARQAAESVLPSFGTAVSKLDEVGDRIAERLSLLEIQAAAAGRAMDGSAAKAAEALEVSRQWVDQQISTIETSVTRVESDVVKRLEKLTESLGVTTGHFELNMPKLVEHLSQQLGGIESSMQTRMTDITAAFDASVLSWDNASMATSAQLIECMSRARAMSAEAVAAAKETTVAITASTQAALSKTVEQANATTQDSLKALQDQAEKMSALAQQADDRHAAMRLVLQDKIHTDFARTADQLIDRLNAYAVDITKLYTGDVTEEELRSYLQGDKTSFVRRFARNFSRASDHQTITQIKQRLKDEPEFADIVGRYLNAFETLLKLGQRRSEKDALTMALMTSDLGKMYMALARAAGRVA